MKFAIVFACIFAAAVAAPLDDSKNAQILRYESDNAGLNGYNFAYETSDGTSRSENAELKNAGTDQEALVVRGTIRWVAPDGQEFVMNYIADELGFRPEGAHLPQPPSV